MTYSQKHLAINKALEYAIQEKETIYVWQGSTGAGEYEYTLRKRSDIIDLKSKQIVHIYRYTGQLPVKFRVHNGLREVARDES